MNASTRSAAPAVVKGCVRFSVLTLFRQVWHEAVIFTLQGFHLVAPHPTSYAPAVQEDDARRALRACGLEK
jgi:hypothetical protein